MLDIHVKHIITNYIIVFCPVPKVPLIIFLLPLYLLHSHSSFVYCPCSCELHISTEMMFFAIAMELDQVITCKKGRYQTKSINVTCHNWQ